MDPIVEQAVEAFQSRYGFRPDVIAQAPGRVNLIGEHTDYNEGFVFPAAIDRWVVFAAAPRTDNQAVIYSAAHEAETKFGTAEAFQATGDWADYPKGVIREFHKLGHKIVGFDALMVGNVPIAAGLSSSAAVEMATGTALKELNAISLSGPDLALLGQRAENTFVGVNCGIMDQFVSANARAGHALFLDCRDLSFELVPLAQEGVRIVICNSGVTRGLTDSAYNNRRLACEEGAAALAKQSGENIGSLRDVSLKTLEEHAGSLSDEVLRRCRHVIGEIERTVDAVNTLKAGDLSAFGELMVESHVSLRDDYEVSGDELNLLVEIALSVPGVLGARLTGAGFGGCTVNLVKEEAVESFINAVESGYPEVSGLDPSFYICSAVNGAECVA